MLRAEGTETELASLRKRRQASGPGEERAGQRGGGGGEGGPLQAAVGPWDPVTILIQRPSISVAQILSGVSRTVTHSILMTKVHSYHYLLLPQRKRPRPRVM